MANLRRYPSSQSRLLSYILERPDLVAAVRQLPKAALSALIEQVGLEDAGELVALVDAKQLEAILDEDLWRPQGAEQEERFDPERFAVWLQVMGEAGTEFLVQRLCELPMDLLTLAVHHLVLVIDEEVMQTYWSGGTDESMELEKALENCAYEEWEEFRLISRDPSAWDDIWHALLALDRDHHTTLRRLLERCFEMSTEFINGQGSLYDVLTSDEMLESDLLASRDDRRSAEGFVSRSDARAFLELARSPQQPLNRRDAMTASYFRTLEKPSRELSRQSRGAEGEKSLVALLQLIAEHPVHRPTALPLVARDEASSEMSKLEDGLHAEPMAVEQAAAGFAPGEGQHGLSRIGERALASALAELSEAHPEVHSERIEELTYLANVLLAGCNHAGGGLRPVAALEAATATCNLGLQLWTGDSRFDHVLSDAQLLLQVSCDRLFRLAWLTLQQEVVQPARAALARCQAASECERHGPSTDELGGVTDSGPHGGADAPWLEPSDYEMLLGMAEELPWWRRDGVGEGATSIWIGSCLELEQARARLERQTG